MREANFRTVQDVTLSPHRFRRIDISISSPGTVRHGGLRRIRRQIREDSVDPPLIAFQKLVRCQRYGGKTESDLSAYIIPLLAAHRQIRTVSTGPDSKVKDAVLFRKINYLSTHAVFELR